MEHNSIKDLIKLLSSINDDQYACTQCSRSPEINEINCENKNINIICPVHKEVIKEIDMETYLKEMSKNTSYNQECSVCKVKQKETKIFYSIEEIKNYCKKHFPEKDKKNKIPVEFVEKKCPLHEKDNFVFCKTCNKSICSNYKEHKNDSHEKHEKIERVEYEPNEDDLGLIYLFNKLITIILKTYEKYKNNYYHCKNITNFAKFLKNSILDDYNNFSIDDDNFEIKMKRLIKSADNNKQKLFDIFNNLYRTNIKEDDKKINLRYKKIGDLGLKLLCRLQLKNLEKLILINNDIENIDDLKYLNCPKLKVLNLGYNKIEKIDVFNEVNFSLTELDLIYNRINDINIFKNMDIPQLKELKTLKLFKNNYLGKKNEEIQIKLQDKKKF